MNEKIFDVYWEGPFPWHQRKDRVKPHHVLYSLHGTHHLYGRDVLLYIGRTEDLEARLDGHEWWVEEEFDPVQLKVASVGPYDNPDAWSRACDKMGADFEYSKADPEVVRQIEALLILAHQPAYNSSSKTSITVPRGLRIFNTGKVGLLHPEVSYVYYEPYD